MSRVSFLLMMAVMASALYLVRTQYESRELASHDGGHGQCAVLGPYAV